MRKQVRRNISHETFLGRTLLFELKTGKSDSATKEIRNSHTVANSNERDSGRGKRNNTTAPQSQQAGNRLVHSFENKSDSNQQEKKGILSGLFGRKGK